MSQGICQLKKLSNLSREKYSWYSLIIILMPVRSLAKYYFSLLILLSWIFFFLWINFVRSSLVVLIFVKRSFLVLLTSSMVWLFYFIHVPLFYLLFPSFYFLWVWFDVVCGLLVSSCFFNCLKQRLRPLIFSFSNRGTSGSNCLFKDCVCYIHKFWHALSSLSASGFDKRSTAIRSYLSKGLYSRYLTICDHRCWLNHGL